MKWISDYKDYLQLSSSVFLSRITPACLNTLVLMFIAKFGSVESLASYALICSVLYPCSMISKTTSIGARFYASKSANNHSTLSCFFGSSVWLTLVISGISMILFLTGSRFFDIALSAGLSLAFSFSILFTSLYATLCAINEGINQTTPNNISNGIAIPLFLINFVFFKLVLVTIDIILVVTLSLLTTYAMMLAYLIKKRSYWFARVEVKSQAIQQLLAFSAPVGCLFTAKKFMGTLLITSLHPLPSVIAAWQMANNLSLYWQLLGQALAAVLLVNSAGHPSKNFKRQLRFLSATLLLVAAITLLMLLGAGDFFISWVAHDSPIAAEVVTHLPLLTTFILSELLMACIVGCCRACGDVWRPETLWILALLVFYKLCPQCMAYAPLLTLLTTVNLLVSALLVVLYQCDRSQPPSPRLTRP